MVALPICPPPATIPARRPGTASPRGAGRGSGTTRVPTALARARAARRRSEHLAALRRRRLVAAATVLGVVVALGPAGRALGGEASGAPGGARPAAEVAAHVVEPGDTLWGIAAALAPGEDPRVVVDAIVAVRGDAPLVPGEVVRWGGR